MYNTVYNYTYLKIIHLKINSFYKPYQVINNYNLQNIKIDKIVNASYLFIKIYLLLI